MKRSSKDIEMIIITRKPVAVKTQAGVRTADGFEANIFYTDGRAALRLMCDPRGDQPELDDAFEMIKKQVEYGDGRG